MAMFDFFFPEAARAGHLTTVAEPDRKLAYEDKHKQMEQMAQMANALKLREKNLKFRSAEHRIDTLTRELGEACLIISAMMETLEEADVCRREDIAKLAREIDLRERELENDEDINPRKKEPFVPKRRWPGGR